MPGGRRGGGQHAIRRGVICWTLACIGDPKSARFMREELLSRLKNMSAFWVRPLRAFYENVARACEGDESVMPAVEQGVGGIVSFMKGAGATVRPLVDTYRRDRPAQDFTPKGERLLGSG